MALSAPLARRLAPSLCRVDPASGESCAWSHGLWQYLRLMGLVTTPEHQAEFLDGAFALVAAGSRSPRVLVSGTADYAMLHQALCAFRRRGVEPEVTVLDICETPLELNRWYAGREGARVRTVRADILDYRDPEGFDAVCTHSFFGRFAPQQRPVLVAKWCELLRPGGHAITVNRLRPEGGERVSFAPEQARAFRDLVSKTAVAMRESLDVAPEELAREAERYTARPAMYPVRSREELAGLLQTGGFAIGHFSTEPVRHAAAPGVRGPTLPGDALYARVIAMRR